MSTRATAIFLFTFCLAVAAGVVAAPALANGTTYYCYPCALSSDGVPAESAVYKDFYYNDMKTTSVVDLQIYNYYSGTKTCSYKNYDFEAVWTGYPYPEYEDSCVPSTVFSSARCHLFDATGPTTAQCFAEYETVG